jgi:YD repeat-containing protein
VGRTAFADGNVIVFTTIKRTKYPLDNFTYSNIQYSYNGSGWARSSNGTTNDPEKIYWSDVTSAHTFTGFCLPSSSYYWQTVTTDNIVTYKGDLGYGVDDKGTIDFSTDNESIIDEDLLVSHSKNVKPETGGASAQVDFKHALSNVCVVVNVTGFATNSLDKKVDVTDMVILNQPCVFTWGADTTTLSTFNVTDTSNNKIKNIKLLRKSVSGENEDKTFVFYGLTTPQNADYRKINGNSDKLSFKFTVTYPNAIDNTQTDTHTYQGTVSDEVLFNSGKCTTINVSLNHKNEKMLVDVNYTDWNYVSTPDLGELRKKSTYMTLTKDDVKIHSTDGVTIDNATWLYTNGNEVYDVYGNDGNTAATAYRITSAAQMLAFAQEVNNAYTFKDKYVRLDADITMQKSATATGYSWIGIGDANNAFQGTFLGGDRYINRLYGSPLFVNLGAYACVEQLYITAIGEVSTGALAGTNAGIIGGCKVIDDVTLSGTTAGALVGTNSSTGTIHACYYTGEGNLIGTDSGTTKGCYQANQLTSLTNSALSTLVTTFNTNLTTWYSDTSNSGKFKSKFQFTYTIGNYPTVQVAP